MTLAINSCKEPRSYTTLPVTHLPSYSHTTHILLTTGTNKQTFVQGHYTDAINCTGGDVTRQRPAPAVTVRTADYLESFLSVLETGELRHDTADPQLHSNSAARSVVLACNRVEADHRTSSHLKSSHTL